MADECASPPVVGDTVSFEDRYVLDMYERALALYSSPPEVARRTALVRRLSEEYGIAPDAVFGVFHRCGCDERLTREAIEAEVGKGNEN